MSDANFRISQPQPAKKKKVFYVKKKNEELPNSDPQYERSLTTNILQKHISKSPYPSGVMMKKEVDAISVVNKKDIIEEQDESELKIHNSDVGPQLRIEKTFLSFIQKTGLVATDSINVYNNGTTAIYYEWVKTETQVSFPNSTLTDKEERFFCHHKKNVIKPGEKISFKFSFLSKVTGIFNEIWMIKCEPPTVEPLPRVKFSGHAIVNDANIEWRSQLSKDLDDRYVLKNITEFIGDIIDNVRTPTPPLPDLNDPEVCKAEFEGKNKSKRVWYTQLIVNIFRSLEHDIYEELGMDPSLQYWDMNLDYLTNLISRIKDYERKLTFERQYDVYLNLARCRPWDRSPLYNEIRGIVENVLLEVPNISLNQRKELDMWDYVFKEPVDMTEDEIKKKADEETKMKNEWVKRTKKKKWDKDDEKALIDNYRSKFSDKIIECLAHHFTGFEHKSPYIIIDHTLANRDPITIQYFDNLLRKKNLKEFDPEGKRILLRVHLSVGRTAEHIQKQKDHEYRIVARMEEEKRLEELKKEEEEKKDAKKGRAAAKPAPPKGKKAKEQEKEQQLLEERRKELNKLDITFLDEKNLSDIIETIKFLLNRLAKLVIVMASYDEPFGRPSHLTTLKFFFEHLKTVIDQTINFQDSIFIEDFQEKMEGDFYPENSVLLFENAYFAKEETGYIHSEDGVLMKLDADDKRNFIERVSEYGTLYVIQDKENIFKEYTSMVSLAPETAILGSLIGHDISVLSYTMTLDRAPFVVIMGGEMFADVFYSINTFLDIADKVILVGKVAIPFIMYQRKLKKFSDYEMDSYKKKCLERVLELSKNQKGKLIIPKDFKYVLQNNEIPKNSSEMVEYVMKNTKNHDIEQPMRPEVEIVKPAQNEPTKQPQQQQKGGKGGDKKQEAAKAQVQSTEENQEIDEQYKGMQETLNDSHTLVDYGPETQKLIEICLVDSKKILWIGSASPVQHQVFNESNKVISKVIFARQEEKKALIKEENEYHEYKDDLVVTVIGEEVEDLMNTFDIIDPMALQKEEDKSNAGDEEEKSEVSVAKTYTQVSKRNNIQLVADFFAKDSAFAYRIAAGKHIPCMHIIDEYAKKLEAHEEEDFSFLDDI